MGYAALVALVLVVLILLAASRATDEEQQHRPRRRQRIEFIRIGQDWVAREVLMPDQHSAKGRLIDPEDDDDADDWGASHRGIGRA